MDKVKTTFKVTIPDREGLTLPLVFQQDAAHKVWVDWGDGSYPDTYSYQGLIEASHKYSAAGDYVITMEAVDDGYIILGGGWTGGNAVGGSDEAAARMLVSARVGTDVTGITDYAFRNCENLEEVTFPKGHELTIGVSAFEGCCSLEEIAIPGNISTIPPCAFFNCNSLRKVTLPTGTYEIKQFAFANCGQLREINLLPPTNIDKYAFAECRMLKMIKLGSSVRTVGEGAFSNCSNARELDLGKAKKIEAVAFCNNKSLYEVFIPATVEAIGKGAFAGCTSLNTIKMAATTPPVLENADAFDMHEGLTIVVPASAARDYKQDSNWAAFTDFIVGR